METTALCAHLQTIPTSVYITAHIHTRSYLRSHARTRLRQHTGRSVHYDIGGLVLKLYFFFGVNGVFNLETR